MAKKTRRKIVRRGGADQISTIPDDVLVRILSLVPTEDAVATSILSKRWKFLWTLTPVLDFDYAPFSEKFNALTLIDQKRRFLEFVEHVLFRHELQPLEKLRLAFDITKFDEYVSKASMLVKLAMRSNCLTIDLEFCNHGPYFLILSGYDKLYTLPACFFPHQSVSQMKLTNCQFTPSLYRNFTSVNIAKLTSVALQKDSVYDLVSQCPCLEELHLIRCQISSPSFELNAPKSNLKFLVVKSCVGNNKWFQIFKHASIHIPTLSKLKYEGSFLGSGCLSLYNSENIIEAEIDIYSRPPPNKLCELLMSLQNVKSLTLFSVKLEETEDEMLFAVDNVDEEAVRQLHLLSSECLAHLMKIKITGFPGIKVQMEFVEHILRSSLCLKEMVICIGSRYYRKFDVRIEHYEAMKKKTILRLLACTRASPDAKILLEDMEDNIGLRKTV